MWAGAVAGRWEGGGREGNAAQRGGGWVAAACDSWAAHHPSPLAQVPRGPGSPPVPVMHSPPRALTAKDQADWKIPPCISNWKNSKGYTIPLDKRLAADGRGLQEVAINDQFAKFTEVG